MHRSELIAFDVCLDNISTTLHLFISPMSINFEASYSQSISDTRASVQNFSLIYCV